MAGTSSATGIPSARTAQLHFSTVVEEATVIRQHIDRILNRQKCAGGIAVPQSSLESPPKRDVRVHTQERLPCRPFLEHRVHSKPQDPHSNTSGSGGSIQPRGLSARANPNILPSPAASKSICTLPDPLLVTASAHISGTSSLQARTFLAPAANFLAPFLGVPDVPAHDTIAPVRRVAVRPQVPPLQLHRVQQAAPGVQTHTFFLRWRSVNQLALTRDRLVWQPAHRFAVRAVYRRVWRTWRLRNTDHSQLRDCSCPLELRAAVAEGHWISLRTAAAIEQWRDVVKHDSKQQHVLFSAATFHLVRQVAWCVCSWRRYAKLDKREQMAMQTVDGMGTASGLRAAWECLKIDLEISMLAAEAFEEWSAETR